MLATWTDMSKAVPKTRSSWFHLARSQSREDHEMTRLAAQETSQVLVEVGKEGGNKEGGRE